MTRALLGVLAAVALAGCGAAGGPHAPAPAPGAERAAVEAAMRADDALRAAYAEADYRPLVGVLDGSALVAARRDLTALGERGARREERLDSRRVVHSSVAPAAAESEVVLELRVRQRLVVAGSQPPWVAVLRQWRARVRRSPAGWRVIEAGDLRPEQWWPAPGGPSGPAG